MISFTSAPAGVFVFLSVIILWLLKKIHVLRAKDVCGSSRKSRGICRGVRGSSRKSLGIYRGVCGSPASLSAFTVAFAGVPASLSAFTVAFAGVPQVSRRLPRGVCGRRRIWPGTCIRPVGGALYPCRPGFRPGLWSTGPTARPGTGERPVGAPDHSQGRNPWAGRVRGSTPAWHLICP